MRIAGAIAYYTFEMQKLGKVHLEGHLIECMRKTYAMPFFTPYANWRIRLQST